MFGLYLRLHLAVCLQQLPEEANAIASAEPATSFAEAVVASAGTSFASPSSEGPASRGLDAEEVRLGKGWGGSLTPTRTCEGWSTQTRV